MIKEWLILNPKLSIVIISFLITLAMTLVTKYYTNQSRMQELKDIQKACNIKLKSAEGNPEKMKEVQKEIMECSLELMKHSMKPMLYTFLPLILLIWWIKDVYADVLTSWIWWYIGAGIISSIILRKALKVV
ncbi:hypothetical protein CMI39_01590 [Candidatus Pacearchaeota archaeon]|jgi:uncharacterized membrane protein (DUF106 family)|nr:hypothetical protein [Candidatus Pacearchaeota archaeon]|tara:strand:- start:23303 stop:23698 length:396 start_codon:yes stop_codon:yes gene_type:complete